MAKKVYAVKVGRQTGLFNTWAECEAQVKGFMGAKFKGFMTAQEAMAWLAGDETPKGQGECSLGARGSRAGRSPKKIKLLLMQGRPTTSSTRMAPACAIPMVPAAGPRC